MRHPLHPTLAHFPVACWSIATIADFATPHYGPSAWHLADVLLWIGALAAIPTIIVGIFELTAIPKEPASVRAGFTHMGIMFMAFILYLVSLLLRDHEGQFIHPDTVARAFSAAGFVFLLVGGWLGGTLVYGHGAGGDHKDGETSA